jgi:hypothetical protein
MPRLTDAQRQEIASKSSDFTYKELSDEYGVSVSTVQRVCSKASGAGSGGADAMPPAERFASDTQTEVAAPQADDDSVEQFEAESKDIQSFLETINEVPATEAAAADEPPPAITAAAEPPPIDFEQAESICRSLGVSADEPPPPKQPKRRRPRATRKAAAADVEPASAMTVVAGNHTDKPPLPLPMARTRLSLMLNSYKQQLIESGFGSEDEVDAVARRVSRMGPGEVEEQTAAVKGVLTLTHSVNGMTNGILCGASIASAVGPSIGLELSNWDRHLVESKQELQDACTFLVLDEWESFADSMSGRSRLCILLMSSAAQCHSSNQLRKAHARSQSASDELLRDLDGQ